MFQDLCQLEISDDEYHLDYVQIKNCSYQQNFSLLSGAQMQMICYGWTIQISV